MDVKKNNINNTLPELFQPFSLRNITFKNRIFVSPMCQYCSDDGHVNVDWHFAHHGRFALSGVGGAMVEASGITRNGRITHSCLGIYKDSHIKNLSKIVSIYHSQNIPIGIQIGHSGRKGSSASPLEGAAPLTQYDPSQAWETIGPSAIAMTEGWPVPRALTTNEIEDLIDAFSIATKRAVKAGFDFIEIHGAHGYLVNSFFSPLANQREDHWGGEKLENRMRFPLRVAEAIRQALPDETPLFYRTSCVDGVEGGVTLNDTIALAKELKLAGVDIIDCSSGGMTGPSGRTRKPPYPGYLVPYADEIRRKADIATMVVGLIIEPTQAEKIIADGSADMVAMGRQMIEDPNFPLHAARELGHTDPLGILPGAYVWPLAHRKID